PVLMFTSVSSKIVTRTVADKVTRRNCFSRRNPPPIPIMSSAEKLGPLTPYVFRAKAGMARGTVPANRPRPRTSVVSPKWLVFCCAQFGLWRGARREHPPQWGCDRRATKPQAKLGATQRAAVLFAPGFVAHSLQIHFGICSSLAPRLERKTLAAKHQPFRRHNTSGTLSLCDFPKSVFEKSFAGSTGDSPDGTGATVRANGDRLFARLLAAVPVGGSSRLRVGSRSPAPPIFKTDSKSEVRCA